MSMNIKDPEAHRLARAIAQTTGETLTGAVTQALRERFERLVHRAERASVEELTAIAARSSAYADQPHQSHGDLLYDDHGLPR